MLSVSVIIPTYNRATLLQEAIDSLLAQTRKPDEIIVVDDGSTDETVSALAGYSSPVQAIALPHAGRSAARNAGLRAATSDVITFLDSDDTLPPNSIARRLSYLEAFPAIDVVYSDAWLVDGKGNELGLFSKYRPGMRPSGTIFSELVLHNFIPIHCAMFRRSVLKENITFDGTLEPCEDYDFWLKLAATCHFAYIDEALVHYRLYGAMTTLKESRQMAEAEVKSQKRVFAMPQFKQLTRRQQARAYCSHGVKNAMIGRAGIARRCFFKAISTAPSYPAGYVLALSSLLGQRWLRSIILLRRRATGNRSWEEILRQVSESRH